MTIQKFNMSIGGRSLHLLFDLEDEFYSDQALSYMLSRGIVPEPEVLHAFPHILEPGDCCVDAGANIGFFTIIMSKLVGKEDGCVIAVEPDPRNARKLRKNLDINDCRNVVIYETPLSVKAGPAKFYVRSENGSSSLFDGADVKTAGSLVEVRETHTATLTTLIGDRKPKLLKMDIEGAELAAIQNCSRKIPFVISEVNEDALALAGASVRQLRFHFEAVWGLSTHILSETGSMPAILQMASRQELVPMKANANVLFARQWDVVKAWPKVIL